MILRIDDADVLLRPAERGDYGFVISTLLESVRHSGLGYPFKGNAWRVLAETFAKSQTCWVACAADAPTTLVGWATGTLGERTYVYVSRGARHHGLGEALSQAVASASERA